MVTYLGANCIVEFHREFTLLARTGPIVDTLTSVPILISDKRETAASLMRVTMMVLPRFNRASGWPSAFRIP